MTDAPSDPPPADLHLRAKVPLYLQVKAAERELAMRYKVYSVRVGKGTMTEAERAAGISEMRAIRDTLRIFLRFEDDVRATLQRCLERKAIEDEVAALQQADTLAGAAIGHVTASPLTTHDSPLTPALEQA